MGYGSKRHDRYVGRCEATRCGVGQVRALVRGSARHAGTVRRHEWLSVGGGKSREGVWAPWAKVGQDDAVGLARQLGP
jgi:hypothetical protein